MVVSAVDGVFSYRVPESLINFIQPGVRVLVPFGHRRITGFVVSVLQGENSRATKFIESLLDRYPVFDKKLLDFTRWVSDYYLCPWGDVLKAALPAGIMLDEQKHWVLESTPNSAEWKTYLETHPLAQKVVELLQTAPASPERMQKSFGQTARSPELRRLKESGIISFRPILRPPRIKSKTDAVVTLTETAIKLYGPDLFTSLRKVNEQRLLREIFEAGPEGVLQSELQKGASSPRREAFAKLVELHLINLHVEEINRWDPTLEHTPDVIVPKELTADQKSAVSSITDSFAKNKFDVFLLFGVTGSGKTQVYIESIREALNQGKTTLVLLPEIALTPFLWNRFYKAFGDKVAIQHSAQSPAVRFDLWREILLGRYPIVVGARSAVFAPLKNIGLIIIDEEQESSFKQFEPAPHYHARDAAIMRARLENATVVLGSATPSVETMQNAYSGKYKILRLPNRVGGAAVPSIDVIALQAKKSFEEQQETKSKKRKVAAIEEVSFLSQELLEKINETLERKKQIILLQNRRGFSPFLVCPACNHLPMCPNCSVSLTYHQKGRTLRCHYCDHRESVHEYCTNCSFPELKAEGLGTQRLEEEVAAYFPWARILRMDSDSVSRRGAHGKMIKAFSDGEYDILIGTQMIAKGLDFPNVDFAAVVQADTELFYPDFRASERGTSLIIQVAGRAGRRDRTGTVLIQSAVPSHQVVQAAMKNDWESFAKNELEIRHQSNFPPFAKLGMIRAAAKEESAVARAMFRLRSLLLQHRVEVLGPAPMVILKLRNQFRYQMLVRTNRADDPSGSRLRGSIKQSLSDYKNARIEPSVSIDVDVDPQSVS